MTRPSERIWAEFGRLDESPGVEGYLPRQSRAPYTLAGVAERVIAGDELRVAVADFCDDLRFARNSTDVMDRIRAEPIPVDKRTDAYLAALAEHTAIDHGIAAPRWSRDPSRFLDYFWWPSKVVALRARTIVESPAAFRRRGIFIGATSLQRV